MANETSVEQDTNASAGNPANGAARPGNPSPAQSRNGGSTRDVDAADIDKLIATSSGGGGPGRRGPGGRGGPGRGGRGGPPWRDRDLTNGSIPKNLWGMSWPQAVEGMMRVIDNMLDLVWAGFLGTPHIAGIGVAQQYTQMAWTARQGIDTAQRAMISRAIGMGNLPLARLSAYQAMTVTTVFWVLIASIGILFTRPLLEILGVPENVIRQAVPYMQVQFAAQGFMAFQQLSNQALVASGDPITPMRSQIVSRICHGLLSPVLVFGFFGLPGFGIAGAPMAAGFGNALALLLNYRALFSERSQLHLRFSDFRIEPKLIWQILRIGGPAAINGAERTIAQLVMVAFVTPFGSNALAAFTLTRRMEMFANLGSQGIGQASGVIVGQNLGAGKPERARTTILWALAFVGSIKGSVSVFLFLFPELVLSIFTRDPELLALSAQWLRILALGNIAMGANNVFQQSFMTAGATVWPMLVTLAGLWLVELPLAYLFSQPMGGGAIGIAWATLIANVARPMLHVPYFLSNRWMRARVFSDQTVAVGARGSPDAVRVGPYSA